MPPESTTPPPTRTTAEGFQRFYVTACVEEPLYQALEAYRYARQLSRSDAIKRILSDTLNN